MNRRKFIGSSAVALPTSLAGCLAENSAPSESETRNDPNDGADGGNGENDANGGGSETTETVDEEPRIDEPPHAIDPPKPAANGSGEWNEEYLGAQMETVPSLDWNRLPIGRGALRETGLRGDDSDEAYWVAVLTSESDCEAVFELDAVDGETRSRLDGVDFDESLLVVVESGYGSGSIDHRWARVESVSDGVRLHGYYTDPSEGTDDITTWVSVLEIERPITDAPLVRVSLTVSEDRRVHFNSTEGVIGIDDESAPPTGNPGSGDESLEPPRDLVLANESDETRTITVTLLGEAGEIHHGEHELEAHTEDRVEDVIAEPGEHVIEATLDSGERDTVKQRVSDEVGDGYITITEDAELFVSYDMT